MYLQKSKINEFDVDIKKLEGMSSNKIKRDLIEAKRKVERKYSPDKLKLLGSVKQQKS